MELPVNSLSWRKMSSVAVLMGTVFSGVATLPAQAQTLQLEEIVVTAEKREVSLQNVSVAVSAFTQDSMDRSGVNDMFDVVTKVPSMHLQVTNGVVWAVMRGAGNANPTAGGDNGVAFHYDGVYMGLASAALADMWDMERVEILRGPQGTLFGRNSTGGSINVIPARPGEEFEAKGDITVSNYETYRFRGAVNLPQTGIMRSRFSLTVTDQNKGYQKNEYALAEQKESEKSKSYVGRALFGFDFTDQTSLLLTLTSSEANGPTNSPTRIEHPQTFALFGPAPKNSDPFETSKNTPEDGFSKMSGVTAELNHDFSGVTLKAIGSYYRIKQSVVYDWDDTELDLIDFNNNDDVKQYSAEIQLLSNDNEQFEWIVGGYFFDLWNRRDNSIDLYNDTPGGGGVIAVDGQMDAQSFAVFGQIGYYLRDDLKLTVGGRWSWDEKSRFVVENVPVPSDPLAPPVTLNTGVISGGSDNNWNEPQGRIALDYNVTDDNMVYASVSRGYKTGGFAVNDSQDPVADPEKVWNFEIGAKNYFLDRRVMFNITGFHMLTDNVQNFLFAPGSLVPSFLNVGDSTAWGVEVDYQFLVSENIRISGSAGWIDATYDGIETLDVADIAAGIKNTAGNQVTQTPEWSLSTGIEYSVPVETGEVTARVDWTYRSRMYFSLFEKELESQAGYHKFDARLIYEKEDRSWIAEVYVQNLTDKATAQTVLAPGGLLGPDQPMVSYNTPRTYGVRVGYAF